jgi:methionyl aminopeptidase
MSKLETLYGLNKWTSVPTQIIKDHYEPKIIYSCDKTRNPINFDSFSSIDYIQNIRQAAELHRETRRYIQNLLKPNISVLSICEMMESQIVKLSNGLFDDCVGFPVTVSINNTAAHYTPSAASTTKLKHSDIVKIDFGTHNNGYIIDSAFSFTFDEKKQPLLDAASESMWAGIKMCGPDAYINDISSAIKETVESYEIELNGKTYPILSSAVLCGHDLSQYTIHGGILIPNVPNKDSNERMIDNQFYAIETFPSTSPNGYMYIDSNAGCDLFTLKPNTQQKKFNFKITNQVYNYIKKKRSTLPFSSRWVEKEVGKSYQVGINELMKNNYLIGYPPIISPPGTLSAQYEHTIFIKDGNKEIISMGDDY